MAASFRLVRPSVVRSMINVSVSGLRCNFKTASRTYLVSCFNLKKSFDQNKLHDAVAVGKDKRNHILNECGLRSYSVAAKLTIDEISDKVMSVCKTFDKIPAEKVTMESHFMTDLGLDSLDHVELIMNVEEEFNLEIPDADAEKLLRPKDIVAYVQTREESIT